MQDDVYVVTTGIYSSKRVVGIFTDKDVADSVAERRKDGAVAHHVLNSIDTPLTLNVDLDAQDVVLMVEDPYKGILRYSDDEMIYFPELTLDEAELLARAESGHVFRTQDGRLAVALVTEWDTTWEETIKIAAERFAQDKAEDERFGLI